MSENKIFGYDVMKIEQSDSDFPERLKNIPSKPKVLYIVGNIKLLNKKEIVAIVGTRDADKYGVEITKRLEDVGDLVGIKLLDHIIIGYNKYISLKEKGLMR